MATITEDYVSFETAKLLKEKGFDEICWRYWSVSENEIYGTDGIPFQNHELVDAFTAPTLQMAMKWLRDVLGLHVYPDYVDFIRHDKVEVWVVKIVDMKTFKDYSLEYTYSSYEQACEAAIKYCIEYIFPELKENKDKRIRENCIHFLELQKSHHASTVEIEECIAWLEKQAEKKSYASETMNEKRDFDSGFTRMMEKEQKPWSEEDEKYTKDLVDYFTGGLSLKHTEDDIANWLKSLKDRYTWKPSDEQMAALKDALNDAIWQYDYKCSLIKEEVTRKHAETIESLYNDLKKLK